MKRLKHIPRSFYDGLYLDFKAHEKELLDVAIPWQQKPGTDSLIILFTSETAQDVAQAMYSYKDRRFVAISARYWYPDEVGCELVIIPLKLLFTKAWKSPLPVRAYKRFGHKNRPHRYEWYNFKMATGGELQFNHYLN